MLFADVDPVAPTTIVGAFIAVSLALCTLIGWLMRHVFMNTIPGMMDSHKEGLASVCGTFKDEIAAERAACAETHATIRADLIAVGASIEKVGIALTASSKEQTAALKEHVTNSAAAYRHEIRDAINEAVLGRSVYLELKKKEKESQ